MLSSVREFFRLQFEDPRWRLWRLSVLLMAALLTPLFANDAWTQMLVFVLIYIGLGLGLNVVVGFAGLLDLGYVAFFAME
jgi:branched-chain amino acid transport system permease protein